MKKKKKRNRHKRTHRTNVGAKFINIVKSEFTEDHVLHKIFNVNTIRLSYSCMPNMAQIVSMHNGKVFQEYKKEAEQNLQNRQNQNLQNKQRQNLQNQNLQQQQQNQQQHQNVSVKKALFTPVK